MEIPSSSLIRLQTQHQALQGLTHGLPVEDLTFRPDPDKWSIHENIAHLGRYQEIFLGRLHQILKQDIPRFAQYRAEWDEASSIWMNKSPDQVIDDLFAQRNLLCAEVEGLSPVSLAHRGVHAKLGIMDIPTWTEFFLLHEAHHLYTIFRLRQQLANILPRDKNP